MLASNGRTQADLYPVKAFGHRMRYKGLEKIYEDQSTNSAGQGLWQLLDLSLGTHGKGRSYAHYECPYTVFRNPVAKI